MPGPLHIKINTSGKAVSLYAADNAHLENAAYSSEAMDDSDNEHTMNIVGTANAANDADSIRIEGYVLCEQVRYVDLSARTHSKLTSIGHYEILDISDAVMGMFDYQAL